MLTSVLLLYWMRVLEVLFGAYRYASIVLTILVINLPLKWAFVASQYYASGPYFLLASLVVVYLRAVPTVRSDSFCLFGSFFLSTKCVLVLALFLSIVFGKTPALVEVLVSGTIALFIAPRPSNPTPLIQCPSALVDAVIVGIAVRIECRASGSLSVRFQPGRDPCTGMRLRKRKWLWTISK